MFLVFSVLLFAAQPATLVPPPALARVEVVQPRPAKPGADVNLIVHVTPREGIHIYAPPQKEYKPVTLAMDPLAGARIAKPRFPAAVIRTFEGERLRVYDGRFAVTVPVLLPRTARGSVALTGTLSYQACDDLICYRPVKVPVRWEIQLQ